jgi:hypothetical protein
LHICSIAPIFELAVIINPQMSTEMIENIDNLILNKFTGDDFLIDLSTLIQEYYNIQPSIKSNDFLFKKENDKNIQRFIAICFLRITANQNFEQLNTKKHQVFKFIIESVPDICQQININEKTETYKKEIQIKDYILEREAEYKTNLIFIGTTNDISKFINEFRRVVNNKKSFLLKSFCENLIEKNGIENLFSNLNLFLTANEDEKHSLYIKIDLLITQFLQKCISINTYYCREYLYNSFQEIKSIIKKEIEKSPYVLPTELDIDKTEKKYPFFKNAKNSISLIISNTGEGYANNVELKIKKYNENEISFSDTVKYLGDIQFNSIVVNFPYESIKEYKTIKIEFDIVWTSNNKEEILTKEIIFESQKTIFNWDDYSTLTPYNLEPVETNSELIGRDNILQSLVKMLNKPLGSAYVYGQRRVGKTSIVKTLLNSVVSEDILIIYIEAGDWNDASDANKSMDNLGIKICKKIKRSKNKFNSVEIPDFNGSFNKISDFLDDISDIDQDFKVLIILDEFDRISSTLYERGDIGKSFVLTLRSISNRPQFGFILVGGEKMEYILSPWQEFNKFSPIRVDYFSRERDWEDFRQLVKKPVENILEITDKAINKLFEETNGNPYFTKKICMELYTLMTSNRDNHVTEKEAEASIKIAENTSNIGATDFSHFWEDGIKGKVEKEEEISLIRRKLLIIMSQILISKEKLTKNRIIDKAYEIGINQGDVEKCLIEYEQRKIIDFKDDSYSFIVRFFKQWLITGGKEKIISTFEEEERVNLYKKFEEELRVKSKEISDIANSLSNYKGNKITPNHIRAWLDQFEEIFDQRLVFKLLQNFKLYSELEIREKLKANFARIQKDLNNRGFERILDINKRKRDEFLVTFIDSSPSKGSTYYTKLFADENNIYSDNVTTPDLIEKKLKEKSGIKALVIIDDIIGTGKTIISNINIYITDEIKEIIKKRKIPIYISTITGFLDSKEKILTAISNDLDCEIFIYDILADDDKCFSNDSRIFDSPIDRKKTKDICLSKGETLEPKMPLGYGNSELLIAFPINCPNNTLPIFWKKSNKWNPLFERI